MAKPEDESVGEMLQRAICDGDITPLEEVSRTVEIIERGGPQYKRALEYIVLGGMGAHEEAIDESCPMVCRHCGRNGTDVVGCAECEDWTTVCEEE